MEKMVYDGAGAVFWDSMAGYRRWNQVVWQKGVKADVMYQVVALPKSPVSWSGQTITFAVIDDFGDLKRVEAA